MAVRQYIGARYVTKIYENSLDHSSAEWEASTNYEPLTLVTYNNGSYLSKKEVPGSVGNPPSNPDYWVQTGFYNGQIASLQGQIDTINNTTIPGIEAEIANIETLNISNKHILFIMDSYGSRTTTGGQTVAEAVETKTGATCHLSYSGGASLADFRYMAENYAGDHDEIDTIFLIGGANDQGATQADIVTRMEAFIDTCHTYYSNLKNIYVLCCGITFSINALYGGYSVASRETLWKGYKQGCINKQAIYIDNGQYLLRNTALLTSDFCHPKAAGIDEIVNAVIAGLIDKHIDVNYTLKCHFDGDLSQLDYRMTRHNGNVTITNGNGLPHFLRGTHSSETIDTTGNDEVRFGEFDESLMDISTEETGLYMIPYYGKYTSSSVDYNCIMGAIISDKVATGYVQRLDSNNPGTASSVEGLIGTFTIYN